MSNTIDFINGDFAVTGTTLDDINAALGDICIVLDDLSNSYDYLLEALIVIIVMLGVIAGACIFRHLRK